MELSLEISTEEKKLFLEHYNEGINIGADGSIILEGDRVYWLDWDPADTDSPVVKVDYFHGWHDQTRFTDHPKRRDGPVASAQLTTRQEPEADAEDWQLINATGGPTVSAVTTLQRVWRIRPRKNRRPSNIHNSFCKVATSIVDVCV